MGESPPTVLVMNGPSTDRLGNVDSLDTRCREWGAKRGLAVEVFHALEETALVSRLRTATEDALVINPGRLDSTGLRRVLEDYSRPSVEVCLEPQRPQSNLGCDLLIWGRRERAYDWALRHLAASAAMPRRLLRYGPEPDQAGDFRVPDRAGPHPALVLLHGGFWRDQWQRDLMDGLAVSLVRSGFATWNLEYRRIAPGGAWPATLLDVADGIDFLGTLEEVDSDRIGVVGHSAGGQLALWAAARGRLPNLPGSAPDVVVQRIVALAPVTDLVTAEWMGLDDHAVAEFLRGDLGSTQNYRLVSPIELLPLGVAQLVVHGDADEFVPVEMSRRFVERARSAGDDVVYEELSKVDHMSLIDPDSGAWRRVEKLLGER